MNFTYRVLITVFLLSPMLLFAQSGKVSDNLTLPSNILKSDRKCSICFPPDYETSNRSYPVLYLLHGSGDDHTGWVQFGEVLKIADEAITKRNSTPIINARCQYRKIRIF